MSKIIFIEGNPGSGKSTFAKRLEQSLLSMGYKVNMYQEGDLHPIDLVWCALLGEEEYQNVMKDYPMLQEDILRLSKKFEDKYVVAYTKVNHKIAPQAFYQTMSNYEIYRTTTLEPFQEIHQKLWKAFPKIMDEETIYIFECVFIQNHINELILKYNLHHESIIQYFNDLIDPLVSLGPQIFFIEQKNVQKAIEHVANERKTTDKTRFKDWIDLVIEYIEDTPYAAKLGYMGYDGIIEYFKDRQEITLALLKYLPVSSMILPLEDNHDELFELILEKVQSII